MATDERRLQMADTERTDPDYSGTLNLGAHPDGELTFDDGGATAESEVAEEIVSRYPNIEFADGSGLSTADAASGDEAEVADPPLDPTTLTVPELGDELGDGDFTAAELDAIEEAERAGEERSTALDTIDEARE